ncbi:unnamed protein product [Urochloa decumbens]|uniref:DUF4283 domain-containing protein n=1 Tax=Urochloa decumbens TaxID=240449 RepID=A0ABC8YI41_9POAL
MVYPSRDRGGGRRDGFGSRRQGRGAGRTGGRQNQWNHWDRGTSGGGSSGAGGQSNFNKRNELEAGAGTDTGKGSNPEAGKGPSEEGEVDFHQQADLEEQFVEDQDKIEDRSRWGHREEKWEKRNTPESSMQAEERAQMKEEGKGNRINNPIPPNRNGGCNICGLRNHATEDCNRRQPCEICGLSNRSTYDCRRSPTWNFGLELCAAQVEDQSFFFIDEHIDPRAFKEKSSTAIISVIEGNATAKHIEVEFQNTVDNIQWRWVARKIADNKFSMRFPDARMVQVYSNFTSLGMKATNAKIRVEPWNSGSSAKGELQQAWFRVRGIPIDQRFIRTVAKVGGLVGKTMLIDEKTRLRGEYVRMRIACRDVRKVPASVESTLDIKIFDFFCEREVLEEEYEEGEKIGVKADEGQPNSKRTKFNNSTPDNINKKASIEHNSSTPGSTNARQPNKQAAASTPGKMGSEKVIELMTDLGKQPTETENPTSNLGESQDTDDSEDFSDKLARINAQYDGKGSPPKDIWLAKCSDLEGLANKKQELLSRKYDILGKAGKVFPEEDLGELNDILQNNILKRPEGGDPKPREERRGSERIQQQINLTTDMKNAAMAKKRNLEGLYKKDFQEKMTEGISTLLSIATRLMAGQNRGAPGLLLMAAADEADDDQDEAEEDDGDHPAA